MMEAKYNNPTDLRPGNPRVLDAPMVSIDLNQYMDQIRDEQTWRTGDKNAMTVFKTEGMRIVLIALHSGTEIAKHKAEGVISVQVLEGKIQFVSDEGTAELSQGMMVTLHKGIEHSVKAVEKSVFLLTIAG